MVASGWSRWMCRGRVTGCPPIIPRAYEPHPPSEAATSRLLSDYRGAPAVITAQPGRSHRPRPARSAPLSLSCNRAASSPPAPQSDRSGLRSILARALGNSSRRPLVTGKCPWGKGGLSIVRPHPSRISGTGEGDKGCSHQLAVGQLAHHWLRNEGRGKACRSLQCHCYCSRVFSSGQVRLSHPHRQPPAPRAHQRPVSLRSRMR
jgi:hypothetical protein